MTAASPVTALKTSSTAIKIVGTAAAVVVAVSIPLALRGVNNNASVFTMTAVFQTA